MTHNCGKGPEECTCITLEEFESLSPNLQRIVRNAHAIVNGQEPDEDEDEHEGQEEQELTVQAATRKALNEDDDRDMLPPVVNYSMDLPVNRDRTEMEAAWKAEQRRLWGDE